jgi:hypothetical protein
LKKSALFEKILINFIRISHHIVVTNNNSCVLLGSFRLEYACIVASTHLRNKRNHTVIVNPGDSVYAFSRERENLGGIPVHLCAAHGSMALLAIDKGLETQAFVLPLSDVQDQREFTARILERVYSVYDRLEHQRDSLFGVTSVDLSRELQNEGLHESMATVCASLANDIDWASSTPLSSWMRKIRDHFYPKGRQACA